MKVILLEDMSKLGACGDQVQVKAGYGRNYLIPQEKALPATAANLKVFEARRSELEAKAAEHLKKAQDRAAACADLKVSIPVKSGEEGKLYGAVTSRDIAEAVSAAAANGVTVDKHEVNLPMGPIRTLGTYPVKISFHSQVSIEIELEVIAMQA